MSSRKRSGSGSKRPKEKVVFLYELLFRSDFEDPTKTNSEFWHEFFLLQPNVESLENEITKLSAEQLIGVKPNINLLFCQSIDLLDSGEFDFCPFANHQPHIKFVLIVYPFDSICMQSIRNVCVTVYKHFAHCSMQSSSATQPKLASIWSIRYSHSTMWKIKWNNWSRNAIICWYPKFRRHQDSCAWNFCW